MRKKQDHSWEPNLTRHWRKRSKMLSKQSAWITEYAAVINTLWHSAKYLPPSLQRVIRSVLKITATTLLLL